MEASRCWGMSSNCSAMAAETSGIVFLLLLRFGRVLIRRPRDAGYFLEVMLGGGRRRLPFQAGSVPGIGGRLLAMFERPDEINQRQQVSDAEHAGAGAGHNVV